MCCFDPFTPLVSGSRWNHCTYNSYRYKFKLNAPLSNNYPALKPSNELNSRKAANEYAKSGLLDADASVQAFDELLNALYMREKQLNQTGSLDPNIHSLAKESREKINSLLRQRLEAQQLKHGTNLFKLDLKNLVLKEDYNDENELRYLIKQIEKEKQALQLLNQEKQESSGQGASSEEAADQSDFGAADTLGHFEPAEMTQLGESLIDNVHLVDDDDATAVKISKSLDAQMNLLKVELDKMRSANDLSKQVPHGLSISSPLEAMMFEKQVKQFNQSMMAYVDVCTQSPNLVSSFDHLTNCFLLPFNS